VVFVCGDQIEQVAVGLGAKGLRAVLVAVKDALGKDARAGNVACGVKAVLLFQALERGQGNAVSAVQVAEGFKDLGFKLGIGAPALSSRFSVLGLRLRGSIGAYNFMNSHGLPASEQVNFG
jgi:hypothetical protein